MKRKTKLLSIIISALLIVTLVPSTAFAADDSYKPYGPSKITATQGGQKIQYYDIYGGNPRQSEEVREIILNALKAKLPSTEYGGLPLYEHWDNLAGIVFGANPDLTTYLSENKNKDHDMYPVTPSSVGAWQRFGSANNQIRYNDNIADIKRQMAAFLFGPNVTHSDTVPDNIIPDQHMLYTINKAIISENSSSDNRSWIILGYGNIFYDFEFAYVNPDGKLGTGLPDSYNNVNDVKGKPGVTYNASNSDIKFTTGVYNHSTGESSAEQLFHTGKQYTVSNEVSQSQELGITKSIGVDTKVSASIPFINLGIEVSNHFGYDTSKVMTTTNGKGYSDTGEWSSDSSITVNLPAHTETLLEQSKGTNTLTVEYDYPIAISYKVLTVGLWGKPEEGATRTISKIAQFGKTAVTSAGQENAVDNLYKRWNNQDIEFSSNGDKINWGNNISAIHSSAKLWQKDLTEYIHIQNPYVSSVLNTNHIWSGAQSYKVLNGIRPMSIAGGKITTSVEGVSSKIHAIVPAYPLKKIVLEKQSAYELKRNEVLYLDDIEIQGLNASNVPYYGFDKRKGYWTLLDSSGKEIKANTTKNKETIYQNNTAALITDNTSGLTYLQANNTDGKVYLKYNIKEEKNKSGAVVGPYTYSNSNKYTKNSDLSSTAVATINVTGTNEKSLPVIDGNTISGTGVPGGSVTIQLPNGKKVTTKIGSNGKWSVSIPGLSGMTNISKITYQYFSPAGTSIGKSVKLKANVKATSIKLPQKKVYLQRGKSATVKAAVYPSTTLNKKVKWSSSDKKKLIKVSSKGKITVSKKAKLGSKATITAKTANGKTYKLTVYVAKKASKVKSVSVTKPPKSIKVGKSATLKPKMKPSKATGAVYTWTTSNKKVATVDAAGKVTAVKKGKATITLKAGGKSKRLTIVVK